MSKSRLLVAVSSPWASQRYVEPIIDLASRLEADIIVAHVAQSQAEDETDSDARQRGEQTLELLTKPLEQEEISVESVMLFSDDVGKAILNTARARQCSAIVLGLSPKGVLHRLLHGEIPTDLARQSDIPVLILPSTWTGTI